MRYEYALIGAGALVNAGPAIQHQARQTAAVSAVDFNAILAADPPAETGPPAIVPSQASVYDAASAVSVASAAGATATPLVSKRTNWLSALLQYFQNLQNNYNNNNNNGGSTSTPCTTSKTTSSTPALTVVPSITLSAVLSSITVPSSCTPISWTNTFAFTTDPACTKGPFEVGTFCGFINPEDPCAVQPDGYGPVPTPDTVAGFFGSSKLHSLAQSAKTPPGYANTFKDYNASVNANSYLGFYTLTSYNVTECAAKCDSTNLCTAFNMYIERDPSWNPWLCTCNNPPSMINFKCSLWGSGVEPAAAVNTGETREQFQVVITGSNGYEKTNSTTPTTPTGCSGPQKCPNGIHSHPKQCVGQKFFPGPYNPEVCGAMAKAFNAGVSKGSKCNFVNSFMMKANGIAKGTYCSLFNQRFDSSQATVNPGWVNGIFWGIESSFSWNL